MKKYSLLILLFASIIQLYAMDSAEAPSRPAPAILSELEQTFFKAIDNNNPILFSECLTKGVDCNVNRCGITALQTICHLGRYHLLPLILNAHGIDVNKADEDGRTPLHYATGHWAVKTPIAHALLMAHLIRKGAVINSKDKYSETPLSKLLKLSSQPAILSEILIDYGADITLTVSLDPDNSIIAETIFERAIRSNSPEQVIACLKSVKGITKPVILKALKLAHFGYNKPEWGKTLCGKTTVNEYDKAEMKAQFKKMGRILRRYYITMQGLGFYADAKTKGSDWQHTSYSVGIPTELAKKIAWHAAKNAPFTLFEKECLINLFQEKNSYLLK